jgi:hypothetical protein
MSSLTALRRDDSRCLRTGVGIGTVRTPMGNASLVFCASCGNAHKRSIVPEDVTYVRYYCTDCVLTFGTPLDDSGKPAVMVPGTEGT